MAQVTPNELFDFPGWFDLLKQGETKTQEFSESLISWLGRVKTGYNQTRQEASALLIDLERLSAGQKNGGQIMAEYGAKAIDNVRKLDAARQAQIGLTQAQAANSKLIGELTDQLTNLQKRYDSLDPASKNYAREQRAILSEVRVVTRAIDAQNKTLQVAKSTVDAAEGSYNHLKQQTDALRKSLAAMPDAYEKGTGAINRQNKAAVSLNEQYQKNLAILGRVERGQGIFNRNVGNYPTTSGGGGGSMLGTIAGAAGIATGAGAAIMIGQKAVETAGKIGDITLEFDSLDAALKVVSNDTDLFTQRQAMLQRVSDQLGQDLSVVEKNYTNLTASSKGTRLEGEATDKIFLAITGSMARLKRPSEDVQRALTAVGQIMSKGTVASEELKGQLSEVLPGAFNAAARAMGVTTSKLNDMLKNGEVLAADLLPKLAVELENTFNPNHEKTVEGLASSMARGRNEGVEWVKWMNIGDKAGAFIGFVTGMARSVREFFSPAVKTSTTLLENQTEALNDLESQLPDLLGRYDELKSKSKLTANEQKELQTVINNLVGLAPSAATGFDQYGNALDVNKGKVLSFAAAQRELNAELNKQALADLQTATSSGMERAAKTQATLNRGTEQKSFNFKPYFLMSAEERRQATDKSAGKRREVPLSDGRTLELQKELQTQNRAVELSLIKRLQLGDKLTAADESYIERSGNAALRQYKIIQDYTAKIADLTTKQAELIGKTTPAEKARREQYIKELTEYKKKRQEIISPTLAADKLSAEDDPAAERRRKAAELAARKRQTAIDKASRDETAKITATSAKELAVLDGDHQDGLVSEQDYIEKRLSITLAGLDKRLAILKKYGKQETDDYQNVLRDKEKAETLYDRSQLQLDLKGSKTKTAGKLADLEVKRQDGSVSESDYLDQQRAIQKAGVNERLLILKDAKQEQSALYKETYSELATYDADYYRDRQRLIRKSYKEEQQVVKEGLSEIDQTLGAEYEQALADIEKYYQQQAAIVEKQVASGKLSKTQGDAKLYSLAMSRLEAERAALESFYMRDRQLSSALIDDKVAALDKLKAAGIGPPAEIEAAENQIRELKKLRDKDAAEDKMRLDKTVADNSQKQDDTTTKKGVDNAKKLEQGRAALWQKSLELAGTGGEAIFSVIKGNLDQESAQLDKQKENELKLAGDNADARARIEEEYAKKQAEIRRKQAIADREQALFRVGISVAQGVAAVLSTGGGTAYADFGISAGLLTAFVVATGALQAAAILAAPLPAYRSGKRAGDGYEGPALAGEAGAELFVDREGYSRLLDKPTYIDTRRGDTIYTASETSQILNDLKRQQSRDRLHQEGEWYRDFPRQMAEGKWQQQFDIHVAAQATQPGLTEAVLKRAFSEALDARPVEQTLIDENFTRKIRKTTSGYQEYIEKRYP